MSSRWFLAVVTSGLCFAAAIAAQSAPQSTKPKPSGQTAGQHQPESAPSGYVLKVTTRLVTLDLIATDSHGNPIRDIKPEELQVFEEHKAQQKIEQFEFVEKLASAASPNPSAIRKPANVYSNQLSLDQLKIPPTVVLMDSLNTQTTNQMQWRSHLLQLLKTLPADTPVAVFLLGSSLKVLQGFTSDGTLLRDALNQSTTGTAMEKDPRDDPNSASNYALDAGAGQGGAMMGAIKQIQDFEKEQYANTFDLRARQTLEALTSIGQYLGGIPGRKNLIWVSESFPISIAPDTTTGSNSFAGIRDYGDQVRIVANALTDAQVAVYPVDVRGLQGQESFKADQSFRGSMSSTQEMNDRLSREDSLRLQSQGTMEAIAQDTGGKTCRNTNDLSGCVATALKDSSTYYELSFYPQNVNWDGKFHKIDIKTSRPGVKLTYRRGYYALDAASLAKKQAPEDRLRKACADLLPSTAIHLSVQAAPPGQSGNSLGGLQYLLLISAAGLGSAQAGDSHSINLGLAMCEFGQKADSFRFSGSDMTKTVSDEIFKGWQAEGIPDRVGLTPAADARRIRFVVLDVSSGLTGAVDIPVLPSDIAKASASVPPPAPVVTTPFVELPDKQKAPAKPKPMASLVFHQTSGQSGFLDWSNDSVVFQGDFPIDQAAKAFFSYTFGNRYQCQSGRFVPVDPADGGPTLKFTFHNHNGKVATVDLKGGQPDYSGDLPVDSLAKSLFDQVWKSSHCQSP